MLSAPHEVRVDHPGMTGSSAPGRSVQSGSLHRGNVIDLSNPNASGSKNNAGNNYNSSSHGSLHSTSAWSVGTTDGLPHDGTKRSSSLAEAMASSNMMSSKKKPSLSNLSNAISSPVNDKPASNLYHERLFHQTSTHVESVLSAACETLCFDIAEMWLRTGPKTHQLTNSHLRPACLSDLGGNELVEVYYGDKSSERTHRLSPALCKRAKEAGGVVWVTSSMKNGGDDEVEDALRCAISDVRSAVAVPVCHKDSCTNVTVIFFSIKRAIIRPPAVEFLVHMSLAAAVAAVNTLAEDLFLNTPEAPQIRNLRRDMSLPKQHSHNMSRSDHFTNEHLHSSSTPDAFRRPQLGVSITGAKLDLKWGNLGNVEYLTDGGNNWIHTAVVNEKPVVVKTLKPECQDVALAINEIEGELDIHSKLNHDHIVSLVGAGTTSKGNRFVVLERLDGGTLTQVLGYDTRIRDRRRRFWKRKHFSYLEVLTHARNLADALSYCHGRAIPGCMCLHRDLKPDNIGFTLDGTLKLLDFGLARIVENASPYTDEIYHMSGETGSLRYMAPEVADSRPYNHKADVYSFGIILWEMVAYKKPYDGLNRESFYVRIVKGNERPPMSRKWPKQLCNLMMECWSPDMHIRPNFDEIVEQLDSLLDAHKVGGSKKIKGISSLIDRHSTWF
mmetsp:Transcript_9168/g.13313  ORF Transcript_9168/g.13313 Transcript_9168/m.13313 type:complete len:669 (+) Transcript_9168:104-2110(+)